jgi:serine phosphatase RsbU (regulator of sigma subunit)
MALPNASSSRVSASAARSPHSVRVAVITPFELADITLESDVTSQAAPASQASQWNARITRELRTATSVILNDAQLILPSGTAQPLDADVAVIIAETACDPVLLQRVVQRTAAALDAALLEQGVPDHSVDLAARIVLVTPESDCVRPKGLSAHFSLETANTSLMPFITGVLASLSGVREMRRELALLGRVVQSMRSELEERNEELQLAALVQRDFLPLELQPIHGVHVGAFYRPLAGVSGDVYHLEQLDDEHLAFFLADAVGHGIPAALLGMAVCRSLELVDRTHGTVKILGPSETLARANRRLVEHQRATTRFATAIAGVLNCRTRRLRLASAGHPAAVLLRAGEAPQELLCDGGILGVFPDEHFAEIEVELRANDRLLLYSDGFEQAFGGAQTPRHLEEFGKLAGAFGALQYIERLTQQVDGEAGSLHQADDLTLLCLSIDHAQEKAGASEQTTMHATRHAA